MIHSIRHILLDIEGTTCPVSFVSEVLFPYAQQQVAAYLEQHQQEGEIQQLLRELWQAWEREEDAQARALLQQSLAAGSDVNLDTGEAAHQAKRADLDPRRLLPYLHWLVERDRKQTAWKDLQGRIWQEGYARGDLKACLFPEVADTLRRWKQLGLELSVYSSGSVAAQKLLYGHSDRGDLRGLFSHWFDTRIGAKQESSSYQAIVESVGCSAAEILFISDSAAELRAAGAAGLQVIFSDREGNPQRDPDGFACIHSLDQLPI